MKVDIYSRQAMEELIRAGFPPNAAVISFCDPGEETPIDYTGKAERVFRVSIHDIDLSVLPEFGLTAETYFPEAEELAKFILEVEENGLDILCQCEYGQSRSAACAAAIRQYFKGDGIKVFADYRYYPNQLIYNKLLSALTLHGFDTKGILYFIRGAKHVSFPYIPNMDAAPTGWPPPLHAPWAPPGETFSFPGSPEDTKAREDSKRVWNATIDRMITLLEEMGKEDSAVSKERSKDEFFVLFSRCFYHLWD